MVMFAAHIPLTTLSLHTDRHLCSIPRSITILDTHFVVPTGIHWSVTTDEVWLLVHISFMQQGLGA